MEYALTCHPDAPSSAISAVTVEIARIEEGLLVVRYVAVGDMAALRVPQPVPYSSRQDDLWKSTCFEIFAAAGSGEAYLEFNFAPSTGWAAYRFAGYRMGREDLPLQAPHFDVDRFSNRLEMTVAVDTTELTNLPAGETWRANLAAVIEEEGGRKSYWALAHPPGAPDFHHPACFAAELPAPQPA